MLQAEDNERREQNDYARTRDAFLRSMEARVGGASSRRPLVTPLIMGLLIVYSDAPCSQILYIPGCFPIIHDESQSVFCLQPSL